MKIALITSTLIAVFALAGCNNPTETTVENQSSQASTDLAHAELSVRQGGRWEGTEYIADGFTFQPVTSFTSPKQLTDHSYYLRYEGPGWENDLVGYRLYLDWRNGIDVFVKTSSDIVLPQVGQDGYDSYHELSDWGGDALKVGKSVGIGALGRWHDEQVSHFKHVEQTSWQLLSDDDQQSRFMVDYKGWQVGDESVDLQTTYQIEAGDPSTTVTVSVSNTIDNLVTGIVKHEGMHYAEQESDNWFMFATYGKQNMLGEGLELGLAVFVKKDQIARKFVGPHDYLVQFAPGTSYEYGFFATWPGHPMQPQNQAEFEAYMAEKLALLEKNQ